MTVVSRCKPLLGSALLLSLVFAAPLYASQAATSAVPAFVNTLMPQPALLERRPGSLRLDDTFSYALNSNAIGFVRQAAVRLMLRLQMCSGVPLRTAPVASGRSATLTVDILTLAHESVPRLGDDESYTLDVDEHHIALRARTWMGALRGMTTLSQLLQPAGAGFVFPSVHIEDAPRFAWRGLLLDPGRHFLPPAVVYRTLDGMAAVKLNVLHWHLTEDQGFRVESLIYPKLQGEGSDGLYYTQQQVRDIIAYAAARGIRVVPEFDMPGHSTSWLVGYPQLGSAPGPFTLAREFGIHDATLDPTRESTYRFLDTFFREMSQLFPDNYVHIGGDESNGNEWRANPRIQAFMKAHGFTTTAQLQAYFNQRIEKILAKNHKQMVGWDEVLNPGLPHQAVIQNWHGTEFLINGVKQGYRVVYSHPYYLDHMYTAGEMFLADPLPANSGLTAAQRQRILGGEACMWGEQVAPLTIDSRIWPRTAAVAERLWSPAADRDVDDMYRRLAVESLRLDSAGLTHISGPERGLRELAATESDRALVLFASTLQPVDFHERYKEQRTSTLTPLDSLVDSVRPDPPLRHRFELLVTSSVHGDSAATRQLQAIFTSWVDAAPALDRLEASSPLLQKAGNRIAEWPKLGTMGLEALSYLASGDSPPVTWQLAQNALLTQAAQPQELVDFAILPALKDLVNATTGSQSTERTTRGGR